MIKIETKMRTEELFKVFADKSRLRIIASLREKPKFVEQLSLQLNISVSTVSFHLKKLQSAGVVSTRKEQYYQLYFVDEKALERSFADCLNGMGSAPTETDRFYDMVIKESFIKGRCAKLPKQTRKRQAVLEEIARRLKRKSGYSTGELNVAIAEICDDFLVCKSEMIDNKLIVERNERYYINV